MRISWIGVLIVVAAGCTRANSEFAGCQPTSCVVLGADCGMLPDGCGGVIDCGACSIGTCGGNGANRCGSAPCTPTANCAGITCGAVSDGCGAIVECGSCATFDLRDTHDLAASDLAHGTIDMAGASRDSGCAAVENCFNDSDDDCDGVINNGCPDSITLGASVPLAAQGSATGTQDAALCPTGQVMVGVTLDYSSLYTNIVRVAVDCSTPVLVRGATAYSVTLAKPSAPAAEFGVVGGFTSVQTMDWSCDSTRFQVAWNTLTDAGNGVYGVGFDCAAGTMSLSAGNALSITFTSLNNKFGFDWGGGTQASEACGPTQALIGYRGWDNVGIDQIQPVCAPLIVHYK